MGDQSAADNRRSHDRRQADGTAETNNTPTSTHHSVQYGSLMDGRGSSSKVRI